MDHPKHNNFSAKWLYSAQFPPHCTVSERQCFYIVRLHRFIGIIPDPKKFSRQRSQIKLYSNQQFRTVMIRFVYQTQCTKFNPYTPHVKTTGKMTRERKKGSSFRILPTAVRKLLQNLIQFLQEDVSVLRCHRQMCRKMLGHSKVNCFRMPSAVRSLGFNFISGTTLIQNF